jgi:exocyst complex protein 7
VPNQVAALMDGEFLDKLNLICPAGVSILYEIAEIAQRVTCADSTKEFCRMFGKATCLTCEEAATRDEEEVT